MSKYTSSREGFELAMKLSLSGTAEEAESYGKETATPEFYHVFNGQKLLYNDYIKSIAEWRDKISDYHPKVHEFLRDGDQLAARMTGTIKVDGVDTFFESFMFAKVDKNSGKLEWLIERSVWGPPGSAPEHGVR